MLLEYASLIRLRYTEPNLVRPYRISQVILFLNINSIYLPKELMISIFAEQCLDDTVLVSTDNILLLHHRIDYDILFYRSFDIVDGPINFGCSQCGRSNNILQINSV